MFSLNEQFYRKYTAMKRKRRSKTFKPQEWRGYTERNRINHQNKFSWSWLKKNVQIIIDRNSEAKFPRRLC